MDGADRRARHRRARRRLRLRLRRRPDRPAAPLQVATTLAYPLGDIVLLSLVVGIVALTRWRPGRAWSLLLVGLAAMAVADVAYTLQSTDLGLPEGAWIDPIYLIAAACLGAQAWQRRTDDDQGRRRASTAGAS